MKKVVCLVLLASLLHAASRISKDDFAKAEAIRKNAERQRIEKNYETALASYQEALKLDPENCKVLSSPAQGPEGARATARGTNFIPASSHRPPLAFNNTSLLIFGSRKQADRTGRGRGRPERAIGTRLAMNALMHFIWKISC
jgi:hypothetical protein